MPYLGSTVFFVTLFGALLVALFGYFLAIRALAPVFVDRAAARFRKRPILTPLLGGVVGGVGLIISIVLLSAGPGPLKLLGTIASASLLAVALAGTTGLAQVIGDGLASPSDEGRLWFRCLKGAAVLELTFLLPIFGWFFVLPIAVFGGLGATIGALTVSVFSGSRTLDHRAESA